MESILAAGHVSKNYRFFMVSSLAGKLSGKLGDWVGVGDIVVSSSLPVPVSQSPREPSRKLILS